MAKNRIPKKIAGVKIPRAIRKNTLMKGLLGNPVGRQIVADALIAAATAAAAALVASRPGGVKKAGKAVANAGEDTLQVARGALKSAASAFTDSLTNAAKLAVGGDDRSRRKQARAH
jgi:hypothetical protein